MNKVQIFSKYLPYSPEYETETERLKLNVIETKYDPVNYIGGDLADDNMVGAKLHLRPLESLTEQEWSEIFSECEIEEYIGYMHREANVVYFTIYGIKQLEIIFSPFSIKSKYPGKCPCTLDIIEALYKRHVDIHGAIEKGFAVDKTKMRA